MFRVDYHIHSSFSGDSNENIDDIIKQAIYLELDEIAITDHLEYDMLGIDEEKWTLDLYTKYNVWGHLDFITRYGGKEFSGMDLNKNWGLITEILEKLIEKGKGIEINTSGYRYNENRVYPCFEIIKKYVELGGKIITVGSDAHRKEDIALDFSKAYDILKELKVEYITTFEKMKPIFKRI